MNLENYLYQSADIINKYRIENIVFNSLYLSKPDGIVYAYKAQGFDLPKKYENEDGFVFNDYMSKLGSNYFLEIKDYDKEQIKKVLTFIVIALILSYVAKNISKAYLKDHLHLPQLRLELPLLHQLQLVQFVHLDDYCEITWTRYTAY